MGVIHLREPYGYILGLLFWAWLMYFLGVKARTFIEVRKKFSKSYIKKNKRGFLNFFLYLNFHRERPLGVWFHLNFISLICILLITVLFPLFYCFHFNAIVYVVLFSLGYLFVIPVSLIANVQSTEEAFKMKNASAFSTCLSIILFTIITVAFSVVWFVHLFHAYIV